MNNVIFVACLCIAINNVSIEIALAAASEPTGPTPALLGTVSKMSEIGCDHSSASEHKLFCAKNKSICFDKNRSFRPHELTHCKIRYDQCMRAWN